MRNFWWQKFMEWTNTFHIIRSELQNKFIAKLDIHMEKSLGGSFLSRNVFACGFQIPALSYCNVCYTYIRMYIYMTEIIQIEQFFYCTESKIKFSKFIGNVGIWMQNSVHDLPWKILDFLGRYKEWVGIHINITSNQKSEYKQTDKDSPWQRKNIQSDY